MRVAAPVPRATADRELHADAPAHGGRGVPSFRLTGSILPVGGGAAALSRSPARWQVRCGFQLELTRRSIIALVELTWEK